MGGDERTCLLLATGHTARPRLGAMFSCTDEAHRDTSPNCCGGNLEQVVSPHFNFRWEKRRGGPVQPQAVSSAVPFSACLFLAAVSLQSVPSPVPAPPPSHLTPQLGFPATASQPCRSCR